MVLTYINTKRSIVLTNLSGLQTKPVLRAIIKLFPSYIIRINLCKAMICEFVLFHKPIKAFKNDLKSATHAYNDSWNRIIGRVIDLYYAIDSVTPFNDVKCYLTKHFTYPNWYFVAMKTSTRHIYIYNQKYHILILGKFDDKNISRRTFEKNIIFYSLENLMT